MPPAIEFLAGSQIDEQRFKSRPNKTMSYSFPIKHLLGSSLPTSGQQWFEFVIHRFAVPDYLLHITTCSYYLYVMVFVRRN